MIDLVDLSVLQLVAMRVSLSWIVAVTAWWAFYRAQVAAERPPPPKSAPPLPPPEQRRQRLRSACTVGVFGGCVGAAVGKRIQRPFHVALRSAIGSFLGATTFLYRDDIAHCLLRLFGPIVRKPNKENEHKPDIVVIPPSRTGSSKKFPIVPFSRKRPTKLKKDYDKKPYSPSWSQTSDDDKNYVEKW